MTEVVNFVCQINTCIVSPCYCIFHTYSNLQNIMISFMSSVNKR